MTDPITQALAAAEQIRRSAGYRGLPSAERAALDSDLSRIERALGRRSDPYAVPFETPNDLRGPGGMIPAGGSAPQTGPGGAPIAPAAPPAAPPRPSGTEALGERARRALDAVDFPSFVAGLIQGTFQAIVDATAHQVREYARLVADLSKTIDQFTQENVGDAQARDWLAARHPRELHVVVPEAGSNQRPRLASRGDDDEAPAWLEDYGLGGASLTDEIVEGPLLQAGRRALGEERMRMLANMVLLGINRIVVDDGQLRARLQFHARAREQVTAEISAQTAGQQTGIAARQSDMRAAVSTMVSTVDVNAQADVAIKAELVGEVSIRFRTQAFDLDRFADAQSMAVIRRHAQGRTGGEPVTAPTPTPTPTPTPSSGGET